MSSWQIMRSRWVRCDKQPGSRLVASHYGIKKWLNFRQILHNVVVVLIWDQINKGKRQMQLQTVYRLKNSGYFITSPWFLSLIIFGRKNTVVIHFDWVNLSKPDLSEKTMVTFFFVNPPVNESSHQTQMVSWPGRKSTKGANKYRLQSFTDQLKIPNHANFLPISLEQRKGFAAVCSTDPPPHTHTHKNACVFVHVYLFQYQDR